MNLNFKVPRGFSEPFCHNSSALAFARRRGAPLLAAGLQSCSCYFA
jgi:hypothetical protein